MFTNPLPTKPTTPSPRRRATLWTRRVGASVAVLAFVAAGCGSSGDSTDQSTEPEPTAQPAATTAPAPTTTPEAPAPTAPPQATAVPGGNVQPDNPDDPNPVDPPGTGTIPARMLIDGESVEANACEVVGSVRVRAGDGVLDTGVVVSGAANAPSMTLLNLTGGVEAEAVEFEAVADDADQYRGTFDPALTDGITTIEVSYNLGVLPCPDSPDN